MFGGGPSDDPQAQETLAALAQGRIPPTAEQRLRENAARQGTPTHIFTSNLSVAELLLTAECGFEPLGQVMGCCVYHVGWQNLQTNWGGWYGSQEWVVLTQAAYDARSLCFGRLEQEASILRADGVVGVRLERTRVDVDDSTIEFKAVGTAVRKKNGPPLGAGQAPFLSNLNGQDHWALRQAGMRPAGFVFGNCSWLQLGGWSQYGAAQSWANAEFSDYTQGVYTAREIALERLSEEAKRFGAIGVVGMEIETTYEPIELPNQGQGYGALLVQFTALGTAIASDPWRPDKVKPLAIMPVS